MRTSHIEENDYFQIPIFSATNKSRPITYDTESVNFKASSIATYNILGILVHICHLAIIIFIGEMNV